MGFVSLLFIFYFFILFLFSLVNHSVYYCGFLVLNSLLCSLMCYLVFGFSWYSLLFCLVYMGGVYILFMFVSVFSPKKSYAVYYKLNYNLFFLILFILLIVGCLLIYGLLNTEFSSFLCKVSEGKLYVVMCLTLLFGFMILSMVMSVKLNYYR